jgi:hypothetical protein
MERSRMVNASAPKINIKGLLQKKEESQIELSNRLAILGNEIEDVEESAVQLGNTTQQCVESEGKVESCRESEE